VEPIAAPIPCLRPIADMEHADVENVSHDIRVQSGDMHGHVIKGVVS